MESSAKVFMRKLKRIHFWILCPLAIVLGLASWFLSVRSLKDETQKNSGKINSLYSTLTSVRGKEKHANDLVAAGMDALIDQRREEVAAAWTERWNQQTNILTWPQELSEKFREKVESLRPIERFVDFPVLPERELVRTLRMEYQEYIKKELVKLADQIGSAWSPAGAAGGGRLDGGVGRRGGMDQQVDHLLVAWNPANQAEIEANHFDWSGNRAGSSGMEGQPIAAGDGIPTLLEILYAQEDLWVLRSIMGVVQRSNEGATTRFSAAVKEIQAIEIGRNAGQSRGQLIQDSGANAATMGDVVSSPDAMTGDYSQPSEAGMQGERIEGQDFMGGLAANSPFDTADRRYVDKNYQPLSGERLRTVMKAVELDPADATLAVAKRMPVRIRLRVDQRKLNRILAECASAELTIEVRQLRINPESSEGMQSGLPSGDAGWSQQPPGMSPAGSADDLFQYDVDVELYGIVYIYNPVDNKILGIAEEPPPADEVPPTDETASRHRDSFETRRASA